MDAAGKTLLVTDRFRVEEVTRCLPDGRSRTRAVVRHPGAVAIIPMIDHDHVCLIENFRVSLNTTLLEIPAGTLEPGEPPLVTAHRELLEETGFRAGVMEHLITFPLSPGVLDERLHLFVARELELGETARELGEEIENRIVSWSTALDLIFQGAPMDAKTIAGLLYYDRYRTRFAG